MEPGVGKRIERKEREPVMIKKIHFLVHPGWLTEPCPIPELKDPVSADNKEIQELFSRYIQKAATIAATDDELMVAFAPVIDTDFVRGFHSEEKPPYAKLIVELKKF